MKIQEVVKGKYLSNSAYIISKFIIIKKKQKNKTKIVVVVGKFTSLNNKNLQDMLPWF